jgi:hypothetical protein
VAGKGRDGKMKPKFRPCKDDKHDFYAAEGNPIAENAGGIFPSVNAGVATGQAKYPIKDIGQSEEKENRN